MCCVTVQIQEELDNLARQAIANAMNVVKSEKYVFTSNDGYMKLLNNMKAYVMRKTTLGRTYAEVAADNTDEVKQCSIPLLALQLSECCISKPVVPVNTVFH